MLYPEKEKSRRITRAERRDGSLWLYSDLFCHRLTPLEKGGIRSVTWLSGDSRLKENISLICPEASEDWSFSETDKKILLSAKDAAVEIDLETSACRWLSPEGKLLLEEAPDEGRSLERFMTRRIVSGMAVTEKVKTADGEKTVIREAASEDAGLSCHARVHFNWQEGECLYGLGQHEEGFLDLRGKTVYIHQANRKIAMPLLMSSLGYGLLMNCGSPMILNDNEYGSYVYFEAVPAIDFCFLNGGGMQGTVSLYRELTGKAAMLPKWAFGYIQSQERFESQKEILDTAEEYRRRGIGLDCVVLDWQSWEYGKWGQKTFDRSRFPDPGEMTDKLHQNGVHFMISVWPSMNAAAENRRDFEDAGLMIPESEFYDPYKKEGRELYWRQTSEGLFRYGIDAWWCDNCEPFTPDWDQLNRPLPGRLFEQYCVQAGLRLPAELSNEYALYHAMGVYEGQRAENSEKRVVNLTRSGYAGHQRFGTILWSGDIEAKWQTLKRQIAAGLNFCASGHPYWTTDIGAFFVRRGKIWYWKGDFPEADADYGYRELMTRWYQWAAFLPVFRGHGTDCRRELWHYGADDDGDGKIFYEAMLSANRLRYSLMPYIYSAAGLTWLEDGSIIKMLAFDYPDDPTARHISVQYMFGDRLMVCPVTEPMYYLPGSEKLPADAPKTRRVYLPEGKWYPLGGHEPLDGGRWIDAEADISKIPVFVKAGSIIPTSSPALSTDEQPKDLHVYVYPSADGKYKFYDDAGDGYGYESGEYTLGEFVWQDGERRLDIPESLRERVKKVEIM